MPLMRMLLLLLKEKELSPRMQAKAHHGIIAV